MCSKSLPYFVSGTVIRGFGRGSKELGIPTANVPESVVNDLPQNLATGIYYGWGSVDDGPIFEQVTSIGWNPFYKNEKKSVETHIIHEFLQDFYGSKLKVVLIGYLRPEKNFDSLEKLICAIREDINQAKTLLQKEDHMIFKDIKYFKNNIKEGHGLCEKISTAS